jgi:hypothetical protein
MVPGCPDGARVSGWCQGVRMVPGYLESDHIWKELKEKWKINYFSLQKVLKRNAGNTKKKLRTLVVYIWFVRRPSCRNLIIESNKKNIILILDSP